MLVGKPPVRPYVAVGMFEVYQGRDDDGTRHSTEDMLRTLRLHAALRGCDALQVMGVELAGKYYVRVVRGVCEMYIDPQAVEADKHRTSGRLLGEGQRCASERPPDSMATDSRTRDTSCSEGVGGLLCASTVPGPTAMPDGDSCPDPLVCLNSVCASPYW